MFGPSDTPRAYARAYTPRRDASHFSQNVAWLLEAAAFGPLHDAAAAACKGGRRPHQGFVGALRDEAVLVAGSATQGSNGQQATISDRRFAISDSSVRFRIKGWVLSPGAGESNQLLVRKRTEESEVAKYLSEIVARWP